MREKLNAIGLPDLRLMAKELGVPNYYRMKKAELVEELALLHEKIQEEKKAEPKKGSPDDTADQNAKTAEKPKKNRFAFTRKNGVKRTESPVKAEESEKREESSAPRAEEKSGTEDAAAVTENETKDSLPKTMSELDSGIRAEGILEIVQEGSYGFIRSNGFFSGSEDVYVAPQQIRRFNLKTGDYISGNRRIPMPNERYSALLFLSEVNGHPVSEMKPLKPFEQRTPEFPHERLFLEYPGCEKSMRIVDLFCPIGKGQRGLIVAQPKVGKTTLLKQIATSLVKNYPNLYILILLIDERPEEVTDMQDSFRETNVQIVYSTFDEQPERHKKATEMVLERAKRLVENNEDVVILTDSLTRMTRAYNLTVAPSGRTLSGGLDPAALEMPKRFFGAARCMREGGSLTILATALQETGSRLDDMVYEEFKGTGNMELVLSRKLSERRFFPAIDILKSSTRRDDLLLSEDEQECLRRIHKLTANERNQEDIVEKLLDAFQNTRSNDELIQRVKLLKI